MVRAMTKAFTKITKTIRTTEDTETQSCQRVASPVACAADLRALRGLCG